MRKILLTIVVVGISFLSVAQKTPNPRHLKRPTLGINFILNDFVTAQRLKATSVSEVLKDKSWANLSQMNPGFSVQYLQGLHKHFDVSARLDGSLIRYQYRNTRETEKSDVIMLESDLSLHGKLLPDNYIVVPYLSGGIGAVMVGNRLGAFMPFGGGLQFNLGKEDVFIYTSMQFRQPVTDWVNYHMHYSVGFAAALTERKETTPAPPPPPPMPVKEKDTDNDGIADINDKCPDKPGTIKYNGCPVPDSDGDGLDDEKDRCPKEKGIAKYEGCPIPDGDGDGINDEEDKCPAIAGLAKYLGCPIPDSDEDGLNDEEDKCPNEPGQAANQGCPTKAEIHQEKIAEVARNVFFATGSATLLKKSFPALDEVVKLLKQNADLSLDVEGHTDNTGTDKINLRLSQSRADAVAKYLKSKGVKAKQVRSKGYGSSQPIADNSTAEGKAQNRRVEMKLK